MDNRQSLLERVRQYIARHIPLSYQHLVLVGLSGGADSVALLSILTELGYRCEACHCNFGLRGEESLRDRRFAESVATELGVPFREVAFDTLAYAEANKVSVEMACRELRYAWFEQQRREAGAAYVGRGSPSRRFHRDDVAQPHTRYGNSGTYRYTTGERFGNTSLVVAQPSRDRIVPFRCTSLFCRR